MSDRHPLAKPEEVAAYLGVPIKTLYQWKLRGTGPSASKIGKHLRYRWEDVEQYVMASAGGRVA